MLTPGTSCKNMIHVIDLVNMLCKLSTVEVHKCLVWNLIDICPKYKNNL